MREFGIKHKKITPRYPRANGEAERLNRSGQNNKVVKTAIAESRQWRKAIDAWLLAYRTTPHTVTGQPPAAIYDVRTKRQRQSSMTTAVSAHKDQPYVIPTARRQQQQQQQQAKGKVLPRH
jgi:hypothetical protein